MFERNAISVERSLFAGKGNAKPTADYVPQLSTDSPAEIDEMPDGNGPATLPEAKPITGAVGLGGLIQRRVEVGQEDAGLVQTEAYPEYEKHEEEARAGREAAQRVQRESAELTAKATQHFDRGMLYETLRLGLPTPSADAVETKPTIPELNHAEPSESPAAPTEEHARPDISAAPTLAPKRRKRRKMTMRLEPEEWVRLKAYADETDRTYQDILSTATNAYMDEVTGESAKPTATARRPAGLPEPESRTAKSPYDWFRTNRMN